MRHVTLSDEMSPHHVTTKVSVAEAAIWTSISQLALGTARLVMSVLIGHLAGKELLGEFTAMISLATFLVLCFPQAIGVAAARFVSSQLARSGSSSADRVARHAQALLLLSALPLAALGLLISGTALTSSWLEAWLQAAMVMCLAASNVIRGIRNGFRRFRAASLWDLIGAVSGVVLMIPILQSGHTGLALLPICVSLLPGVITGWSRQPSTMRGALRGQFRRYCWWTSIHILSAGALLSVVTLVVATLTTPKELGNFAAASSIATPALLLSLSLRSAIEPFVARDFAAGRRDASLGSVDALMRSMVLIFVPVFVLLAIWSAQIITAVYPPSFSSARPSLLIQLGAVGVACLNAPHVWLSGAHLRGPKLLAQCNFAGLVVGSFVAVILVPSAGAAGGSLGLLAGTITSTSATVVIVWRSTHMAWSAPMVRVMTGVAIGVLICGISTNADWRERAGISAGFICGWAILGAAEARRSWVMIKGI